MYHTFLILGFFKSWAKLPLTGELNTQKRSCPAYAPLKAGREAQKRLAPSHQGNTGRRQKGETKKALHSDKQNPAANCMSPESNSNYILGDTADFCGSTALPHQHLAHSIAQDLVLQLHLLHGLIFGIKEHFAILNKASEGNKGRASKRTLQLVSFPQWATGLFPLCWRTYIFFPPGGAHTLQITLNKVFTQKFIYFTQRPYSLY